MQGLTSSNGGFAGLMSTNKLEFEWRKVHKSLNLELSNNPKIGFIKRILMLSFSDLPYELRNCFLNCCVYPEDQMIRRKRFIRLWIAEGFVKLVRGATLDEIPENYLMELICRRMIDRLGVWEHHLRYGKQLCFLDGLQKLKILNTKHKLSDEPRASLLKHHHQSSSAARALQLNSRYRFKVSSPNIPGEMNTDAIIPVYVHRMDLYVQLLCG
ncbi:hypothetical protein DKX38_023052 [Salix brachista]|uniref:Disease resistance protein winged helix domain-containing protein n=1 Tax=Salix brachista TaxID=2182728 RepID=A0A5N5K5R5_9ROSI|nr:hypothetical protein DKX38_023052 [Salix brachista]